MPLFLREQRLRRLQRAGPQHVLQLLGLCQQARRMPKQRMRNRSWRWRKLVRHGCGMRRTAASRSLPGRPVHSGNWRGPRPVRLKRRLCRKARGLCEQCLRGGFRLRHEHVRVGHGVRIWFNPPRLFQQRLSRALRPRPQYLRHDRRLHRQALRMLGKYVRRCPRQRPRHLPCRLAMRRTSSSAALSQELFRRHLHTSIGNRS